mmetsp:Transcript_4916/g.14214  ORF Transcript_4916/g.14214 Transcript_4916/m.14214 type:complete len:239 (+) Transcript_4916:775-1491(+)
MFVVFGAFRCEPAILVPVFPLNNDTLPEEPSVLTRFDLVEPENFIGHNLDGIDAVQVDPVFRFFLVQPVKVDPLFPLGLLGFCWIGNVFYNYSLVIVFVVITVHSYRAPNRILILQLPPRLLELWIELWHLLGTVRFPAGRRRAFVVFALDPGRGRFGRSGFVVALFSARTRGIFLFGQKVVPDLVAVVVGNKHKVLFAFQDLGYHPGVFLIVFPLYRETTTQKPLFFIAQLSFFDVF